VYNYSRLDKKKPPEEGGLKVAEPVVGPTSLEGHKRRDSRRKRKT
jgi:hypothetical protein